VDNLVSGSKISQCYKLEYRPSNLTVGYFGVGFSYLVNFPRDPGQEVKRKRKEVNPISVY